MGQLRETQIPVKLFFALMTADPALFDQCEAALTAEYGPLDLRDEIYDFDPLTDYYAEEFGTGLRKRMVAAERLIPPENLVDIKRRTNEIEFSLAGHDAKSDKSDDIKQRTINIDPGYLCHSKIVLATTKDQAHRLYMGQGIFEEVTLSYRKKENGYQPNPWTYPDYRMTGRIDFFNRLRQIYCRQLAEL